MDSYGDELREKLLKVFDELVEKRCCVHGIHNSSQANEQALNSMREIINEQWVRASKAARTL